MTTPPIDKQLLEKNRAREASVKKHYFRRGVSEEASANLPGDEYGDTAWVRRTGGSLVGVGELEQYYW